jgi:hypothetical protein
LGLSAKSESTFRIERNLVAVLEAAGVAVAEKTVAAVVVDDKFAELAAAAVVVVAAAAVAVTVEEMTFVVALEAAE